jgi:NADH-quinone oxidoreductase subunit G
MSATEQHTDLITVTIDDIALQVPKGTLVVEVAKQIQRDVPVYCYHPKLGPAGLCRICLVEIEGMPKLQIACNTTVTPGMVVRTLSDKANEGRRAVLELLLLNHPLDCPICDKGGECDLQDFAMAYGQGASRMVDAKDSKPKAVDLGPTIVLDEERCILCLRCVRFDDLITHERSLRTDDRGAHAIIATATGQPYVSDFTGNVTELCPVGALTSKTYRFRSRPWDNHRTTTTCTQCSVGCQMHVDARVQQIARTMSVTEDDAISDGWLCDRGRYNVGFVNDDRRLTQPLYKQNGEWLQIAWDDAIELWANALRSAIAKDGPVSAGAVGGGRLLNEEAFLLQHVYRALGIENLDWRAGRQVRAWPGPLPIRGHHVELAEADVIITYGEPPAQTAPILDLRVRKAVARGALLISIGEHLASTVLPCTRVATFAEATARIPAGARKIAVVWDGIETGEAHAIAAWAGSLDDAAARFRLYVPGESPNAFGAETLGLLPRDGGLDTRAMFEAARDGKFATLALLGVNPVLHFPDRELAIAALRATPFVVVSELFMTETAELATLVLPACSAFEKSGTTTSFAGDVLPVMASVPSPDATQADGDMLVSLAEALGVTLPLPEELDALVRERVAGVPQNPPLPAPDGAPRAIASAETLRVVVETSIFAGGGTLANDARLAALVTQPRARVNPATAKALDLIDGDTIDVSGPNQARLDGLTVALDAYVPEGAVALVDGLPAAPLNSLRGAVSVVVAAKRRTGEPVHA